MAPGRPPARVETPGFLVNIVERIARTPVAALEFSNILLTQGDATVGVTPKDVVWTHRKTTLYRYRSDHRTHAIPVLLVFALINRPDIFDLRPGNSFVEFLLDEGFDVFLIDWGYPEEEDADMGLENYVLDELQWGIREVLRASGQQQLSLLGWCIGGTLCLLYAGAVPDNPVRNMVLLTTPVDTRGSLYQKWVGRDSFDVGYVADGYGAVPGQAIDWANKLMKPVTNYWTTYRTLWEAVLEGKPRREAYQSMARWIADNPPFPARAYREWITWMYKENRLVSGTLRLRGRRVDLASADQNLLVVTAGADHIAPPQGTHALLDLVGSEDVTRLDRPGGHIGLMAGSKARQEIWPDIAGWLAQRSKNERRGNRNGNRRNT
jgi:polyhydroxyalkanoate synthase